MLTGEQTDQLVQDIRREFPAFQVSQRTYRLTGEYVVVVHDPANRNEVRITSLRSDWRKKVAAMAVVGRRNPGSGAGDD